MTENTEPQTPEAEAKPAKEKKPPQPKQNGVTQPREGTKTRLVWDTIYGMQQDVKNPMPYASDVIAAPALKDIPQATIQTQYNAYRRFYNLAPVGRKPAEKPAEPAAADTSNQNAA